MGRRIGKTIQQQHLHGERIKAHYRDDFYWLGDVLLQEIRTNLNEQDWGQTHKEQHRITYLHEPDSFRPLLQLHQVQEQAEQVYYYHLDHLGTPQELTDHYGHIVWQATYSGFGGVRKVHSSGAHNPIRFQGQYEDSEIDLHYNRFRYYDPMSGQYTQPDPIGLAGGTANLYEYPSDPVGWIDPLGLQGDPCRRAYVKTGGRWLISKIKSLFTDKTVVPKVVTPNAQQAANLKRFQKKIPSNAKENVELRNLPNNGVAVQATSPGKVPGSKAVYEKQIDVNGKTVQATKTTYDPQGNIVHVKDKLNGGTYP